jgi:4-hydroxy-tetrahydrodipicolinate synthase
MGSARFGKVLTAMVTPFDDGGALDLNGAARLAQWLIDHGSDGLVLAGTTGEAPTLTDDEKIALWQAVRDAVDVPLLAGTGSFDTRHTIGLSERAAEVGVDGQLVVVPYYNRPPQSGIDAHMRAVAAATDLPVVMYDVPGRTGRAMTVDTIVGLAAEVPAIVGLKDARARPDEAARIVVEAPDDFDLYSGDDAYTLSLLAAGAVGVIGVATHWVGELMGEMIAAFDKGDLARAREVNARMFDSYTYEANDVWQHATGAKSVLNELGLPGGPGRLPLPVHCDEARVEARKIIAALGVSK